MKTATIIVSRLFPKGHPKAGKPTEFVQKILKGTKIHTIRENVDYWTKQMEAVQAGDAFLSVRMWLGTPRKSPQMETYRFYRGSVQPVELSLENGDVKAVIDGKEYGNPEELAVNDGLELQDLVDWFGLDKKSFKGVIVHFTNFRYE